MGKVKIKPDTQGRLSFTKALNIVIAFILIFSLTIPMYARAEYQKREVKAYFYNEEQSGTFDCIFVDGVPVPYIDITKYFEAVYSSEYNLEPEGGDRYRFYNDRGYMIFDPEHDTIVINSLDTFIYNDSVSAESSMKDKNEEGDDSTAYFEFGGNRYLSDVTEVELNLGKYNIDIIEDEEKIYLPLTTFNILFGGSYDVPVYSNDEISITGGDSKPLVDCTINLNKLTREESEAEYTYNNLCFFMDTVYGCPPLCGMSDIIRENGFDLAMDSTDDTRLVKRLLKSTETVDFLYGIAVLSEMLYDGGHTYLEDPIIDNIDATAVEKFNDVGENENDPRTILFNKWTSINKPARDAHNKIKEYNDGYKSYTPIFAEYNGNGTIKAAYFEYDDTGIYVFSSFEEDTIKNFRKALDLAKEHGMKNFLLDESYNEGGKAPVMCYMLGIMTNQKSLYYMSTFSGDILESVYKCDYNLDGIFGDSREDAGYDFKYGILCSTNAFSCGSLLPVYAKEAGIPIIGETSGGGTCVVGYFNLPNAYNGQYSSYKTIVYQDGNDVEKGATPDYNITKLAADGSVDYSDFHDFALLDSILDRHYADKSPASEDVVASVGQNVKVSSVPKTGDRVWNYKTQIPCLFIDGKPLFESDDIIAWLKEN